ncbi:cupin [Lutimonas halocynthiae]|uniref:cupin n=1 Tax=Lutimonas halocynthiae TaxID=1446477 RepID=UPI0025B5A07D|nr:cupin [Lutimonas halocynthiae]MDN3642739.1 cupin [Lutimonas halocynthiae]
MKTASIANDLNYNETKPNVSVLLETDNSKELRILLKKGQSMKEHQTPFPIVVEIFEGNIIFGVNGEKHNFKKGDMLSLDGSVPHDLEALSDSIIRLSLSKKDKINRVKGVANS